MNVNNYRAFLSNRTQFWIEANKEHYDGLTAVKALISFSRSGKKIDQQILKEIHDHLYGIKELNPVRIFNKSFQISFKEAADKLYSNYYNVSKIFIKKAYASALPKEVIILILSIFPLPNLDYKIFVTKMYQEKINWLKKSTHPAILKESRFVQALPTTVLLKK